MPVGVWIACFTAWTVFTAWIVFGRGANWLEDNLAVAAVVDWFSATWSAEQFRVYFGLWWFLVAGWFVFGLFDQDVRTFWL